MQCSNCVTATALHKASLFLLERLKAFDVPTSVGATASPVADEALNVIVTELSTIVNCVVWFLGG